MDEGNHIIQLAVGGGVTVAGTSWIVKYFLTRLMKRIEDIESVLSGKPGDAESKGLIGLVQANTDNDENREDAHKKLEEKFDKYIDGNPGKEISIALEKFRKEMEMNYKKK